MRRLSTPVAAFALAGVLTAGLASCVTPADTDTSSAAPPAAASTAASDGAGERAVADVPREFTASIGEDFILGEERVDDASALVDENVEVLTYKPIQISPDSSLLEYDPTEDYALRDPSWTGMMEFPEDVSDAAMSTASRYVVETWMDSPIYFETDPERNTAWFEDNKHVFVESIHESIVEDLTSPGDRIWVVGAVNPNADGSSAENTIEAAPAYDVAPTRWTGVHITPTRVIGAWGEGGEDPTEYAYASYHVTADQLLAQITDPESPGLNRTLLVRPFEAHIGLRMVRFEGNDRWQIAGIKSDGSFVGTPVAELEHPWD